MKRIPCSLCHHTPASPPKKMTQLLGSRLPSTKQLPLHAGGCTAAPFSRPKAQAGCHPRPRSLCPHCPPRSLWMPPASSSSSGGAGGIWNVCELEEEANRAFNLWNLEEEAAKPPHAGQSTLPCQHNSLLEKSKFPNPALAAPLDTSRPNYQGSEEDKGRTERGKNAGSV